MFAEPEFWVSVSFGLFIALVLYFNVPRLIAKSLDARSLAIARELEDARKLRQEAEALLADYRARSSKAAEETAAILAQAERDAAAYGREARAAFDETIARRSSMAVQKIRREEEESRKAIRAQAAEMAAALSERLLRDNITPQRAAELIDTGIESVKKRVH